MTTKWLRLMLRGLIDLLAAFVVPFLLWLSSVGAAFQAGRVRDTTWASHPNGLALLVIVSVSWGVAWAIGLALCFIFKGTPGSYFTRQHTQSEQRQLTLRTALASVALVGVAVGFIVVAFFHCAFSTTCSPVWDGAAVAVLAVVLTAGIGLLFAGWLAFTRS